MIHVALLRGINVGGNNTVPMARLRELCGSLGWRETQTYINSGNVVFSAPAKKTTGMAGALEDAIEADLGFRCRVLVRTGSDIQAIAASVPDAWSNGPEMKTDIVYLMDDVDPVEASASLSPREGVDHVLHAPGALIWMVERKDATRSGLGKIVGTDLYRAATVRNVNTARKLAAMVSAAGT